MDSYLQEKAKEAGSVTSVYRKNCSSCVNRLQRRFGREKQYYLAKLQHDKESFNKSLIIAKRGLRDGGKERQRILKDLDRNANKRKQSYLNEVRQLKEISKQV